MIGTAYTPGTSIIHRADPRFQLLALLIWVVAFIYPSDLASQGECYLGVIVLFAIGLPLRSILVPIRSIWPILVLVLLLTPPFHVGGRTILDIGGWYRLSTAGLGEALRLILRFTGITSVFFLFFRTTSIDDFILALQWFGMPYTAALVITIAFRYIPSLISLYGNIQDAHALRRPAAQNSHGYHPVRRFTHIFPTLVSVMIHSIKGIPNLSMALELRGFGRHERRTSYRTLPALGKVVHQLGVLIIVLLYIILVHFF